MALTQISTAGVKDDAVTAGKIPADAIGSSEIAANAVGSSELADGAVTGTQIAANAVGQAALADNAVDTDAIVDDAVTADKLANSINSAIAANTSKVQTTINSNADSRIIVGSNTANTLNARSGVTIDASNNVLIGTTSSRPAEFTLPNGAAFRASPLGQFQSTVTDDTNMLINRNGGDGQMIGFRKAGGAIGELGASGGTLYVQFGSTNTAAHRLDDYEEGTFTPSWDAGGGVTFSYNHQYGFYTKIGDTVTFQIYLMGHASTITGGNSGNGVVIQGLPYTLLNHSRYYPAFTIGRTYNVQINDNKRLYAYGDSNSTNVRLIQEENDTAGTLLTAVQLDRNPSLMQVGGVYRV